jgi:uncharacterized SAM-binding protein YcdF (DUF218 family)
MTARGSRRRSLRRGLGVGIVVLAIAWATGFMMFMRGAQRSPALPDHADGIVALTGGAERVETALRLLAAGRANWLLVSGIGGGADLADFARRAGLSPGPLADRVTLGREAISTRGNAEETLAWTRAKGIHSLIVVTAWYHMPRALTELHRGLPNVVLHPAPVRPEGPRVAGLVTARLLIEEYMKYLAARLDLTALLPERENMLAKGAHRR